MSIQVSKGIFDSTEIRVTGIDQPLAPVVKEEEDKNRKGAVFIYLVGKEVAVAFLSAVLANDYKLHRSVDNNNTIVCYKWCNLDVPDKVPEFATSVGGCGALVLSPDHKQVLLVWEYGKWKVVSGSIERGESAGECIRREVEEEVGLQVRTGNDIVYLGGFHLAAAREGKINDYFMCFAVDVVSSTDFKVDKFEIEKAKWFDVEQLMTVYNQLGNLPRKSSPKAIGDSVEALGSAFSVSMLYWLAAFVGGRGKYVKVVGQTTLVL